MSSEEETPQGHQLKVWRDLVESEGWTLLIEHLKREWGPEGYGRKMQAARASVQAGPNRAHELEHLADRIEATAVAVNEIADWPAQQIRALTPAAKSRRPFANLRRA